MAAKYTNTEPNLTGIPKRSLDRVLHHLLIQKFQRQEQGHSSASLHQPHHPSFIINYYKSFRLLDRLRGASLSLRQTQFAKKPKNPV
ncbi:MAG TPA: hypothetical protein VG847_07390 [Chitinophagaceae bacterium]|nr:hypothetical protein [Chitinophagaceae bacterium]